MEDANLLQRVKKMTVEKITKKIKVTQVHSPIGRKKYQRDTLIGLGLNKMMKSRVLEDTSSVRGMINSVQHLLVVEDVTA